MEFQFKSKSKLEYDDCYIQFIENNLEKQKQSSSQLDNRNKKKTDKISSSDTCNLHIRNTNVVHKLTPRQRNN